MVNYTTSNEHHHRLAPLYGDAEIFLKLLKTKFWKNLVFNRKTAAYQFVSEFFKLKLAMITFASTALFRYNFGTRTVGLILSVLTIFMLIGLNSSYLFWVAKPFFPFSGAFFFAFGDMQFCQELLWVKVHSKAMLVYTGLFTLASFTHSIGIFLGFSNRDDPTKRGDSILYRLFFRYSRVTEEVIQKFIEPLITISIAAACWYLADDKVFAVFLGLSGVTCFLQEVLDGAERMRIKHVV